MAVLHKVKQKSKALIESQHVLRSITVASFLESTIVPIPLEAVLVPLMQARREIIWQIAAMATLGCILGALFGYALGFYLFSLVGDWVIEVFSTPEQFKQAKLQMQQQGFWFVLTLGIAPVPFQIAMLAAGAISYSMPLFILATFIARSIRYFGLAWIVYIAGNQAEHTILQYKTKAVIGITAVVLGLWWLSAQF